MCSSCGEWPECQYCGLCCEGTCGDPDSCRSCWTDSSHRSMYSDFDEIEECIDSECPCSCHSIVDTCDLIRFDEDITVWQRSAAQRAKHYERRGVFPFLKLPGEVRDRIYRLSLCQVGSFKYSGTHRGRIDTASLATCRQINREARHLPLTINELVFKDPIYALHFFGSQLQPTQRNLVQNVSIELTGLGDAYGNATRLVIKQMAKLNVRWLGVTLKGHVSKDFFEAHSCFSDIFTPLKQNLRGFHLVIGSGAIKEEDKKTIATEIEKRLIEKPAEISVDVSKRAAPKTSRREPAVKRLKVTSGSTSQTPSKKLSSGRYYHCSGHWSGMGKRTVVKENLLRRYQVLEAYAQASPSGISAVNIRLSKAREAVRLGKAHEYGRLAASITSTLDEQLSAQISTRKSLGLAPLGGY